MRTFIFLFLILTAYTAVAQEAELKEILSLWKVNWSKPKTAEFKNYFEYKSVHDPKKSPRAILLKGIESEGYFPGDTNPESDAKLIPKGWKQDTNVDADGPSGSRWGYRKGHLRLIFNQHYKCEHSDDPKDRQSPCPDEGSTVTVFLGK